MDAAMVAIVSRMMTMMVKEGRNYVSLPRRRCRLQSENISGDKWIPRWLPLFPE